MANLQRVTGSPHQIPVNNEGDPEGGDGASAPVSIHTFCHQISGTEFEQQKLASSRKAMEELLEMLLTDQNLNEKQRCKKLKQVTTGSDRVIPRRPDGGPDFSVFPFLVSEVVPRHLQSEVPLLRAAKEAKD